MEDENWNWWTCIETVTRIEVHSQSHKSYCSAPSRFLFGCGVGIRIGLGSLSESELSSTITDFLSGSGEDQSFCAPIAVASLRIIFLFHPISFVFFVVKVSSPYIESLDLPIWLNNHWCYWIFAKYCETHRLSSPRVQSIVKDVISWANPQVRRLESLASDRGQYFSRKKLNRWPQGARYSKWFNAFLDAYRKRNTKSKTGVGRYRGL